MGLNLKRSFVITSFVVLINITFFLNVPGSAFALQTNSVVFKINSTEYLVNGKRNFMEVAPFIKNSRTYLPVRYVAEAMGIAPDNITYSNGTVTIKKGDKLIRLFVNSQILVVDGKSIAMDTSTIIIGGRTMLPIKWVAEAFGATATWNQTTKSVSISYADQTSTVLKVEDLPSLTYPSIADDDKLSKSYTWSYNGITYKWNVVIPKTIYKYDATFYRLADHFLDSDFDRQNKLLKGTPDAKLKDMFVSLCSGGNYTWWVNESSNNAYIENVSKCFSDQAAYDGYDYLHTAEFVQSFVGGALEYKAFDAPQLPAHTMVDNGDCKGKSILLACILKNMGYEVALLDFDPLPGSETGHIAVGLALDNSKAPTKTDYDCYFYDYQGTEYFYTETTSPGFHIGEYGDLNDITINLKTADIYPIN